MINPHPRVGGGSEAAKLSKKTAQFLPIKIHRYSLDDNQRRNIGAKPGTAESPIPIVEADITDHGHEVLRVGRRTPETKLAFLQHVSEVHAEPTLRRSGKLNRLGVQPNTDHKH